MYDLIVIGTGPGGYHAAIRAAQLGLKVAAVEAGAVGGVCLNVGCIPTKALLHAAETLEHAAKAAEFGLVFAEPERDLAKMGKWRDKIVKKLTGGVASLLKGNGVELVKGFAKFTGPRELEVDGKKLEARKVIVATGSKPARLAGFEPDGERVLTSTEMLRVENGVPPRLLVIGGGVIGLEFASIYARLGAQVTVVEYTDQILPGSDPELVKLLARSLKKQGIAVRTATKAVGYEETKNGLRVTVEPVTGGKPETLDADKILLAVGRVPVTEGLNLEAAGVRTDERGFVPTNEHMETNVPGAYAIGDVARPPMLAHKAMKEGLVAAEHAAGRAAAFDQQIPSVVYTQPEFASVGMTEAEAEKRGLKVRVGRFPFSASGRALTLQQTEGVIKVLADAENDLLLGVHILGPGASDLIAEATLALEMAATAGDLALTVHPHPTLAENLMEAAENLHGRAIHILNR
ncbi:dihydrolipoyl dehydrogenase [Oceanithermus desulfurans]|uniref:Dihydrolipoyl dehydrogenase n=2 Tax=Oceanithermus desulfurans TaxID=227924 RepID=A0A511RIQ2_9DEIN|nr:dihydrolipoyl dehydrogenase [Oceanithermus desulfurans]MBB6030158.1 dihydrolipoamide dehydrogenase [Oceanithermus desulfurans]GEM88716.1 dihydrolipoyl dehydrogenase [Oceanithermus desulfurans NBRC 100063]